MKAIIVTSGGMDSTAAVYWAWHRYGGDIGCISFDYGQRHRKELECAGSIADSLSVPWQVVDLDINKLMVGSGSALVEEDVDVPEGHYAHESMKSTVVPNRNSIMANIAAAYAISQGAEALVLGVHSGDHDVYPDCRPEFIDRLNDLLQTANEGFMHEDFRVIAPFMDMTKADIARLGVHNDVPFGKTWTCYNGGEIHCGRCSTCVERLEAFDIAGYEDPVQYEDREFWKTVIND